MSEEKTIQYLKQRVVEYAKTAKQVGLHVDPNCLDPFKDSGLVFIHQPSFRKWLGNKYKFYCSQPMAMEAISRLEAQPRFINRNNKTGHKVYGIDVDSEDDKVRELARAS